MTTALILGAAVWADGPSPTMVRRTRQGAALFHGGHVTHIIVCGGMGQHPPREADVMAKLLRDAGVPDDAITREDQSTTTGENIRNAAAMVHHADVIIVTDWFHAPRARLIARRAGLRASTSSPPLRGARFWPQTKGALREIPAYVAYFIGIKH